MDNLDVVVKILGTGLAGFGFLLMYLAYKLINTVACQQHVSGLVIKAINRYMLICFIMTITVGGFTVLSTTYKNNLVAQQAKQIDEKGIALNVLSASQKNTVLADSITQFAGTDSGASAKQAQIKVLDTLSHYIAKANDTALNFKFNMYRRRVLSISDSLHLPGLEKTQSDSLKKAYRRLNSSINELSLRALKIK